MKISSRSEINMNIGRAERFNLSLNLYYRFILVYQYK